MRCTYKRTEWHRNHSKGIGSVELTIGQKNALIDGASHPLSAAPRNPNGTTLVPLRFINEAMGVGEKPVHPGSGKKTIVIDAGHGGSDPGANGRHREDAGEGLQS
ncbi:stalk domain-containing protein [Paenibacillus borealis]|uniref:stalk domain-containing protein n=1 Tax=Paenibacillus borealis TaxID=160799 RepID=UPI0009DCF71D|nr:stalk domain-containing protein [Paenibacillus borealis]